MDAKTRAQLIREANTAFNDGDYAKARKLYVETNYRDGLKRMGDYFMYERKLPMLAFGYYKKAGIQEKVDEIFQRMIFALSEWLGKDKIKPEFLARTNQDSKPLDPEDFTVHPILKQKALEILQKNENKS
jgi:hypothetical protein